MIFYKYSLSKNNYLLFFKVKNVNFEENFLGACFE